MSDRNVQRNPMTVDASTVRGPDIRAAHVDPSTWPDIQTDTTCTGYGFQA